MRNWRLWLILGVALALRLGLFMGAWNAPGRYCATDSPGYSDLAKELLAGGGFHQTRSPEPELFRTPGYPVFLAGIYAVAGDSPRVVVLAQIVLDVILCLVTFLLGRRLLGEKAGLWAAGIQAVFPVAVISPCRVLSESLFTFVLTLAMLCLVACLRGRRRWPAAAGGLLLGLACLIRPVAVPLAPAIFVVLLGASIRRGQRGRLVWACVFLLAAALPVAAWTVRNDRATGGKYPALSSSGDYNLYTVRALAFADSTGAALTPEQRRLRDQPDAERLRQARAGIWRNDPEFFQECRRQGSSILAAHPLAYAWFHLRMTIHVFLPPAVEVLESCGVTTGGRGTLPVLWKEGLAAAINHYFEGRTWAIWLALPVVLVTVAIYLAAAVGVVKCWRLGWGAAGWLIAGAILFFVLVPGPAANARFLAPAAPLISVLAAAGIARRPRSAETLPQSTPSSQRS